MTIIPYAPVKSVSFRFQQTESHPEIVIYFSYITPLLVEVYGSERIDLHEEPILLDSDCIASSINLFVARFYYSKYITDFKK